METAEQIEGENPLNTILKGQKSCGHSPLCFNFDRSVAASFKGNTQNKAQCRLEPEKNWLALWKIGKESKTSNKKTNQASSGKHAPSSQYAHVHEEIITPKTDEDSRRCCSDLTQITFGS